MINPLLRAFVINALRRASYRYPSRTECMKAARVDRGLYRCNHCKEIHRRNNVQVDHIRPVIDPETGFTTFDSYIERLFVGVEFLQVLCKPCHKAKSKAENAIRRKKR